MRIKFFGVQLQTIKGSGFVGLFGHGVGWKDLRQMPLSFSERNGHKRQITVGHYSFATF